MPTYFTQSPDAVKTYPVDWYDWLTPYADTINTSTFTVAPSGLTLASGSHTTTNASITASGGTAGTSYTVTNHITTTGGQSEDQSFTVRVQQR